MNLKHPHITIVGGGMTGLSAAFYLAKTIQAERLPIRFTLVEASGRLGGKVRTEHRDGFIIEQGPDSLLARKKAGPQLIAELGLEHETVRNQTGQSYILHHNRLFPIPEGAVMGIPTRLTPFAATPVISPLGKMRALLGDLLLPRSPQHADQSVGHFFRRRLGNEIVERLIEPLLSGIYAGNIDQLSLMATFPQFYHQEQKYRSLMIGMKKTAPQTKKGEAQGAFLTLKRGLSSLVEAITDHLSPAAIRLNTALTRIEKAESGYTLYFRDGNSIATDAVILAVPHDVTTHVLAHYPFLHLNRDVTATSVATVALAFDAKDIHIPYEGTGFVVTRTSKHTITACTWTHKKWPHTTPEGKVLIRSYVGRAGDQTIVDQSDETIVQTVLHDLQAVTPIKGNPLFYIVTRWREGMPQYVVGHKEWLKQVHDQLDKHLPGIRLAGASYEGVGLPDCIEQGKKAAMQTIDHIKTRLL
ncbi:MAG: protoporphyrinogen oxidase [Bacillus thermozeamaize]|jgi:oxygen-dependent protoporphyrinogen oxidase|uniref:Coproporphyrinogen III oxidase n=1 Tax=Bacillus thermozeamaize TaxID=230954 RepID=A0A1Y3PLQ0_9BACI|nr:MAG: protoporphyrinogen oxidase [Bacillus thermozeamaize]